MLNAIRRQYTTQDITINPLKTDKDVEYPPLYSAALQYLLYI